MKRLMMYLVAVGVLLCVAAGTVHAAEATSQESEVTETTETTAEVSETDAISAPVAPKTTLTNVDFDLPAPNLWQFVHRRVVHFFTFNRVKRAHQEVELATLKLLAAQQELEAGNDTEATALLDEFTTEMDAVSQRVQALAAELAADQDDDAIVALLERIQSERALQAALTEQLSELDQAAARQAALESRTKALRDLAKLLTVDRPTQAELGQRVATIATKLGKREQDATLQRARHLALIDELADDIDDDFQDELDGVESDELEAIGTEDLEAIETLVEHIEASFAKHVLVLQALLERVPASAQPAIQTSIDRGIEKLTNRLKSDQSLLEKLFRPEQQAEAYQKIIERLAEEADKAADDTTKQALEVAREQTKQAIEAKREAAKDAKEDQQEDEQDEKEDANEDEDEGVEKDESSSTSSNDSSDEDEDEDEVETKTITIEIEDSAFKNRSYEVDKGTVLTIRFRNRDDVTHNLTMAGSSTTTGSVAPDGESTLTVTANDDIELYCSLHPSIPRVTITAE